MTRIWLVNYHQVVYWAIFAVTLKTFGDFWWKWEVSTFNFTQVS